MSFDLGKNTSFSPPPPPKRRLGPWAVAGIGCLVLVVGAVIGVSVLAVQFSNTMKQELKKPIVKEQILLDLEDTPLYPGIQFDVEGTKTGRAGMAWFSRFVPSKKATVAGFRTQDGPGKVYEWYDLELSKLGFHREEGRGQGRGGRAYRKEKTMVIVQTEEQKGDWNVLVLIRFAGMKR